METLETLARFAWLVETLFKIIKYVKIKKKKKGFELAISFPFWNR